MYVHISAKTAGSAMGSPGAKAPTDWAAAIVATRCSITISSTANTNTPDAAVVSGADGPRATRCIQGLDIGRNLLFSCPHPCKTNRKVLKNREEINSSHIWVVVTISVVVDWLPVLIFLGAGLVIPPIMLFIGQLLRPYRPSTRKLSTYECGETPVGDTRIQWKVQYYLLALVFVIFDVETLFLYPWAVAFVQLGAMGIIEVFLFIGVLLVGLLYAWRRGALEWTG